MTAAVGSHDVAALLLTPAANPESPPLAVAAGLPQKGDIVPKNKQERKEGEEGKERNENGNVFSVYRYGARGDGKHNDTAAIQATIDAAAAAGGGDLDLGLIINF